MAKIHDIVTTSRLSAEYDGSLIDVIGFAKTDLDNGRLVVKNHVTGEVSYATSTSKELYLHNSVERMADLTKGLTEFYVPTGKKVRITRLVLGDEYETTAFTGTVAKGDTVTIDANGLVKKIATPAGTETFLATVTALSTLGFSSFSYGMDSIPAIKIKVTKLV